eukprot:6369678-Amphidinium_carterae.2
MFRNDRKQRDIRELENYIPQVIKFLEAWENVPQNNQPPWYRAALANYNIVERLKWIFFDHDNPKHWISPLPDAAMQVILAADEAPISANTGYQNSGLNYVQQTQTTPNHSPNAGPSYIQHPNDAECPRWNAYCFFSSRSMAIIHPIRCNTAGECRSSSLIVAENHPVKLAVELRTAAMEQSVTVPIKHDADVRICEAGLWMELTRSQVDAALRHAQDLVDEGKVRTQEPVIQHPPITIDDENVYMMSALDEAEVNLRYYARPETTRRSLVRTGTDQYGDTVHLYPPMDLSTPLVVELDADVLDEQRRNVAPASSIKSSASSRDNPTNRLNITDAEVW